MKRDPWTLTRWALEHGQNLGLQPTERHLLLVLVGYADLDTGVCFPSLQRLAADTGRSERVVTRSLAQLQHLGVIERHGRGPGRPRGTRLLVPSDWTPTSTQTESPPAATQGLDSPSTSPLTRRGRPPELPVELELHSGDPAVCGRASENGEASNIPPLRLVGGTDTDPTVVLADQIVGILDRGIAGLTTEEGMKAPTADVIRDALLEHDDHEEYAVGCALIARRIVQEENRAPNIAGLFKSLLDETAAVA